MCGVLFRSVSLSTGSYMRSLRAAIDTREAAARLYVAEMNEELEAPDGDGAPPTRVRDMTELRKCCFRLLERMQRIYIFVDCSMDADIFRGVYSSVVFCGFWRTLGGLGHKRSSSVCTDPGFGGLLWPRVLAAENRSRYLLHKGHPLTPLHRHSNSPGGLMNGLALIQTGNVNINREPPASNNSNTIPQTML